MTGNKHLSCVFCRFLRLAESYRCLQQGKTRRLITGWFANTRPISTTYGLSARTTGIDEGAKETSQSESSSSDSSGSDSDTEKHVVKEAKSSSPKAVNTPDLLALLKAGEKRWGDKKEAESNLKSIKQSVDKKLVTEAKKLSQVLPGDRSKTESALLGQLLSQFDTTAKQKKGHQPKDTAKKTSLGDIMEGITIEKGKVSQKGARFEKFEQYSDAKEDKKKAMAFREPGVGLFSGKPLGIFGKEDLENTKEEKRSLFEVIEEEKREQLQFYPPRNAFEEQIQWTVEGKLWTFPIDNEAGWEEEKKVEFHEHVFLERHLSAFPKKGPIRHFMELVVTALSKNPYMTVQQKSEHIAWYKNYFMEKQTILEERLGRDGIIASEQQDKLQ